MLLIVIDTLILWNPLIYSTLYWYVARYGYAKSASKINLSRIPFYKVISGHLRYVISVFNNQRNLWNIFIRLSNCQLVIRLSFWLTRMHTSLQIVMCIFQLESEPQLAAVHYCSPLYPESLEIATLLRNIANQLVLRFPNLVVPNLTSVTLIAHQVQLKFSLYFNLAQFFVSHHLCSKHFIYPIDQWSARHHTALSM